jgi:16S rRNA (cytidine1402-2'-O)-methyltransferase
MKNEDTPHLPPGLYLVSTPVGNLRDVTLRALDALRAADLVACEDTRVTGKLLNAYDIRAKMVPYNDHNAARQRGPLLDAVAEGKIVALVSDAGTPMISDPGYKLVREAVGRGLPVIPMPGANALLPALQLSALPTDAFLFAGFLPPRSAARRAALSVWTHVPATLVFYETGPRLHASLMDMQAVLGDRPAAVSREITKRFEETKRGALSDLASLYKDNQPKGEIVVVIGGAVESAAADPDEQLREALTTMSVRDAASFVATATGQPKRDIYKRALEMQKEER